MRWPLAPKMRPLAASDWSEASQATIGATFLGSRAVPAADSDGAGSDESTPSPRSVMRVEAPGAMQFVVTP